MGFSKKHQKVEATKESDGKKRVIAGIGIKAPPLKPISTKVRGDGAEEERPTTPTARESRIPEIMTCPPAPRKRRPAPTCQIPRDFFVVPPDWESLFILLGERAN
ncbi:hypothetical protein ACS0TY_005777 [Phlomoides rotata]